MIAKLLIGAFLISLLPIWRGYGHSRHDGVDSWHFAHDLLERADWTAAQGWPHIPYQEAKDRARAAYNERFS